MAITITGNIQFTGGFTWINPPVTYFTDPYYNLTTLQLNGETPSISWITDASPQVNAITTSGNVTPNRFSPIGPVGYYSNYFNGSSVLTTPSNSQFAWGTGDFTVELWFYNTVAFVSGGNVVAGTLAAGGGLLYGNTSFGMAWNVFGGSNIVQYTPQLALNSWYHIAYSRRSSTGYLFINGALVGSAADTTNYTYATFAIGGTSSQRITGYVSNLRVVKGQALYTTAFTPATQPLTAIGTQTSLLTAMGPSFTDYSPNGFAFTLTGTPSVQLAQPFGPVPNPATVPARQDGYYSNYFNGTAAYLKTQSLPTFSPTSQAFTMECWIYMPALPGGNVGVIMAGSANTNPNCVGMYVNSSGVLNWYNGSVLATYTLTTNQWYHVAYVRVGTGTSQGYAYVNGQLVALFTDSSTYTSPMPLYVGVSVYGAANNTEYFPGYISNARMVIGTALYTSTAFTPSTQPLTIVNNTQTVLLTSLNGIISDSSSYANTVTNNSSATIVAAVQSPFTLPTVSLPTASLGSGFFDGSTGYLSTPFNANFVLGSGSYTAEAWIYLTSGTGATYGQQVMGTYQGGSNIPGWAILVNYTTGAKGISWVINNTSIASYTSYLLAGQWYHIAIVRNGTGTNNTTIYLNGISVAQVTDNTLDSNTSNPLNIGIQTNASGSYFPGYISNARFVKGTAIYTTNFAPSNQPLTAVAGTSLLTLQNRQGNNNNIFQDDSPNNFAITRVGTPTQGSFSPFSQNGWSVYFDGSSGYLAPQTGALTFNGNFTIECWVYDFGTVSYSTPWGARTGTSGFTGGTLQRNNGNNLQFAWNNGGGTITQTNGSYTPNTWHHVALTLSGTTLTLWVDGVNVGTGSLTPPFVLGTNTLNIGIDPYNRVSACYFPGYISNFRITNGAALYTTAFTPSTVALTTATGSTGTVTLLTAQANRLVDVSSSATTITPSGTVSVQPISPFTNMSSGTVPTGVYSYYFNGGYLTIPWNTAFGMGTGAFTVEAWFYLTGALGILPLWGNLDSSGSEQGLGITISATGIQVARVNVASDVNASFTFASNIWYHLAVSRDGTGTMRIFVNGIQCFSGSNTQNYTNPQASTMAIGQEYTAGMPTGYISNFRLVVGTGVYTAAFTPPTTALTAIPGTVLLTAQSSSFTDASTLSNTLTVTGNVQPRQQSPFILTTQSLTSNQYSTTLVGGSMYFNGTTDYLTASSSALLSSTFTIELWIYPTSTSGTQVPFYWNGTSGSPGVSGVTLQLTGGSPSAALTLYASTNGTSWSVTGASLGSISPYAWSHYALVRNGSSGTFTSYVNGVLAATVSLAGSLYAGTTNLVGAYPPSVAAEYFNGYISNFRIVNNTALYTTNFTPPTAPLQPIAPITVVSTSTSTIASTGLLLLGTNGGIVDQSGRSNLVTVGTAAISNNVFKTGTGSMYFNGTTDYLTFPSSPNLAFGTGNFTIEAWIYLTGTGQSTIFVSGITNSANNAALYVQQSGTANIALYNNGVAPAKLSVTTSFTLYTWYHIAVVRLGSTNTAYVNGVLVGSSTDSTTWASTGGARIGNDGIGGNPFSGYIDDLRITNGYARYQSTATFTPSSIGLPVQ